MHFLKTMLRVLRTCCLLATITLGLASIIATSSGDDDNTPAPEVAWRIATEAVDEDANGSIDFIREYLYNSDGDIATKNRYTGGTVTGSPTQVITYNYDTDGTLLSEEVDDGVDNVIDQLTTFSYNSGVKTGEVDIGNDGNVDFTDTYNSRNDRTQREFEIGGVTIILTYTISYNPDTDFLEEAMERTYENGTLTGTRTDTYANTEDGNGNLSRVEKDMDNNQTVDEIKQFTYERL